MADYIKLVQSLAELNEFKSSNNFITPNVTAIYGDTIVDYNPYVELNYLKFTAETNNSTIWLISKTSPDIKYSLNGGEWIQWNYLTITLNTGDTVRMKGNNNNGFNTQLSRNQFKMNGKISAGGNIMSLLYDDDFEGKLTIPCTFCFADLFRDCTSLITAPELPATTLDNWCYLDMFDGTSLTTTPELPATTLAECCYYYMFAHCPSLTIVPELPATTLVKECYQGMFYGSSSLNYIKMLATNISAYNCLSAWVGGVSSTGTFVKHPNMASLPTGKNGIPSGWTVEDA